MNSLAIFSDSFYFQATLVSLGFFVVCSFYFCIAQQKVRLVKAVQYMIVGLIVDFFSCLYGGQIDALSQYFSVNYLITVELCFELVVMFFLITSASYIMLGKTLRSIYIFLCAVIMCVIILYFSIVSPNGLAVNVLRNLIPTVAYAFTAAAFFTQCFRRHAGGYILGCVFMSFITYSASMGLYSTYSSGLIFTGAIGYIGMGISLLLIMIDIKADQLDKMNKDIEKYNQRIKDIIKLSPFPIVISRLSDDSILLANDNFIKLFGINAKEIGYYRFRDFFVDIDNRRLLNTHLEKEKIIKDFEILVKSKNGDSPFWLSTSANVIDFDYDIAIYAAFQDITDRKKREDLLQTQASHDPLTSLYNRRYFEEEINRRISLNTDSVFSVFMIDADHFKRVNDTYGHKIGDKVLIKLASTVEKALRDNDIVARYGGEEFVVYLSNSNADDAFAVAERLRQAISEIIVLGDSGEEIRFTVSIGISSSDSTKDINTLIKMADDALYQAKEGGRNRCVVYQFELPKEAKEQKQDKFEENVHPAFDKNNNVEVSLLSKGEIKPDEGGL